MEHNTTRLSPTRWTSRLNSALRGAVQRRSWVHSVVKYLGYINRWVEMPIYAQRYSLRSNQVLEVTIRVCRVWQKAVWYFKFGCCGIKMQERRMNAVVLFTTLNARNKCRFGEAKSSTWLVGSTYFAKRSYAVTQIKKPGEVRHDRADAIWHHIIARLIKIAFND